MPQQRLFRAKILGYFALHTHITRCSAALIELESTVNQLMKSVLTNCRGWILSSVSVAFALLVATNPSIVFPDVVRFAVLVLGSMTLGMAYACIDVVNTGFVFVCVVLMISISFVSWQRSYDVYKPLLGAVPASAIAYVVAIVVISIGLYVRICRELLTTKGFCISMATQLVGCGVLVFGVIISIMLEGVRRG